MPQIPHPAGEVGREVLICNTKTINREGGMIHEV